MTEFNRIFVIIPLSVFLTSAGFCQNQAGSGPWNLTAPFQSCDVDGSITLYDYNKKFWISSDMEDSRRPTLPASTFKIVNTLIALEAGVIQDESEVIKWPGSPDTLRYGYRPEIYRDMNMKEAFQASAGWAYVELAKKIGKKAYRKHLEASRYGNIDLSVEGDDFWNFGSFAITPVNQIEILVGIHQETLPFQKESFRILKEMMISGQTERYTLRAKTGWARYGGMDTGWWVGYFEKPENVYFFATRIVKERSMENEKFSNCRKEITREIITKLGFL